MPRTSGPYGSARMSPARRDIALAVREIEAAFTVDTLAQRLRTRGTPVALATVYRAVAAMEKTGTLARVGEDAGKALYTYCAKGDHHHHLVCTGCGTVEPVDCPLDDTALKSAGDAGFVITHHEIRLYGTCRACLRSPRGSGR